jgi:diacylglycerol kinase family enzyme
VTLVCVGNGRSTGGGFYLTPQAMLDDGLFDICIIEGVSRAKIFNYLPRTIKGTHVRLPGVRVYRSKRVVVRSNENFPVHIDGEVLNPYPEKLEIVLEKRKFKLAMPEKAS